MCTNRQQQAIIIISVDGEKGEGGECPEESVSYSLNLSYS